MIDDIRVVFVSVPREEANKLARGIVEERLAACINVVPKIESYYWWEDGVQHDHEALLVIKTIYARMAGLKEYVTDHHPYDLPEIISLPLTGGLTNYLNWIRKETEVQG